MNFGESVSLERTLELYPQPTDDAMLAKDNIRPIQCFAFPTGVGSQVDGLRVNARFRVEQATRGIAS